VSTTSLGSALVLPFRGAACLPEVRRWLRANLDAADLDAVALVADAELVCTELIANAVEHGGGVGRVRIEVLVGPGVLVEVEDGAPGAELTPGRSRFGGHRGRGLTITAALADWGVVRTDSRKTVWAIL
jgi:anti-sigma regulatory factor (Ser/Thr protein kinase)